MGIEAFRYDGKRALVVGGATGIGEATGRLVTELGGEVSVMDLKPVTADITKTIQLDLRDRASIDAGLDAVDGPVHALFACAGVSGEPFSGVDVMLINFIGQRHLIEAAVERGLLPAGSAIAVIASIGGLGWDRRLETIIEFLDTPDFDAARQWAEDHPKQAEYTFSKQAFITYCRRQAVPFIRRGIRINATGPGPTTTPLMASTPSWSVFASKEFRAQTGLAESTADQQAHPLAFLNSDAASFVNGQVLYVDGGYIAAGTTRAIDAQLVAALAPPLS